MTTNPILDELYAVRAKLLADAGGDIDRLLAGIRKREAESLRLAAEVTASSIPEDEVAPEGDRAPRALRTKQGRLGK